MSTGGKSSGPTDQDTDDIVEPAVATKKKRLNEGDIEILEDVMKPEPVVFDTITIDDHKEDEDSTEVVKDKSTDDPLRIKEDHDDEAIKQQPEELFFQNEIDLDKINPQKKDLVTVKLNAKPESIDFADRFNPTKPTKSLEDRMKARIKKAASNESSSYSQAKKMMTAENIEEVIMFNGATQLHEAVCTGMTFRIAELIKKGYDVNARDDKGLTPLHYLFLGPSKCDWKEIVDIFVENGADLSARDNKGHDLITLMLQFNTFHRTLEDKRYCDSIYAYTLDYMLRKNHDPTKIDILKNFIKYTPDPVEQIQFPARWRRIMKNYQLLKENEDFYTPDPNFLIFLVRRIVRCYFPADGNTPILLLIKQGALPALIVEVLHNATFFRYQDYDVINATNCTGDRALPLVLTLYPPDHSDELIKILLRKGANPDLPPGGQLKTILELPNFAGLKSETLQAIFEHKKTTNIDEIKFVFKTSLKLLELFLEGRFIRSTEHICSLVRKAVPNAYTKVIGLYETQITRLLQSKGEVKNKNQQIMRINSTLKNIFKKLYFTHHVEVNYYEGEEMTLLQEMISKHAKLSVMSDLMDIVLGFEGIDFGMGSRTVPVPPLMFALVSGDLKLAEKLVHNTPLEGIDFSPLFNLKNPDFTRPLYLLIKNKRFEVPPQFTEPAFIERCQDAGVGNEYLDFIGRYNSQRLTLDS